MTAPRPVLLVSGGPVTQSLWAPLAEHYDLAFLYAQAGQTAQSMGLTAAPLASVMDGDLQEVIGNQAALLAAKVVNAIPQISTRFAAAYGSAAPPPLNGRLREWFAGYAHHILHGELSVLAQLERLASTGRRIAGCVTHEDVAPDTRAMVAWANSRNVPTIHVPHAPCHLLPSVRDIHRETRATWILASGPAVAEFYAESGHDPAHITITGGPQWDELYHGAIPGHDEARRIIAAADYEKYHALPWLCYMTTWGQTTSLRSDFDREFDAGFQAVLAHAAATGAFLCILIHWHDQRPEAEENYAKMLEAAGVPGMVTRLHKTYVLRAIDCLIAQGPSNMAIDAAILGTPSCYLETEGFNFVTALPYRGTPDTIGTSIAQALERGGDWESFIATYNSAHPDGGASEAVTAKVIELCL